jgi:hypothetical protein
MLGAKVLVFAPFTNGEFSLSNHSTTPSNTSTPTTLQKNKINLIL